MTTRPTRRCEEGTGRGRNRRTAASCWSKSGRIGGDAGGGGGGEGEGGGGVVSGKGGRQKVKVSAVQITPSSPAAVGCEQADVSPWKVHVPSVSATLPGIGVFTRPLSPPYPSSSHPLTVPPRVRLILASLPPPPPCLPPPSPTPSSSPAQRSMVPSHFFLTTSWDERGETALIFPLLARFTCDRHFRQPQCP